MAEKETVLTLAYDFLLYTTPQVGKYPKTHKYTLGDRIQVYMIELLEGLVEAYYAPASSKRPMLTKCNLLLEKLRYLFRLSKDLNCMSVKTYGLVSEKIQAIGQQVGGWIKSLNG